MHNNDRKVKEKRSHIAEIYTFSPREIGQEVCAGDLNGDWGGVGRGGTFSHFLLLGLLTPWGGLSDNTLSTFSDIFASESDSVSRY